MTCDRPDSPRSSRRSFLCAGAALVMAGVDLSAQAPRAATPANIANPRGHIGVQGETGALEYRMIAIREA